MKLNARKVVTTVHGHPDIIAESNITHSELLGITTTTSRKHEKTKMKLIPKILLAVAALVELGNREEEPINSENVEIYALKEFHLRIRALLREQKYYNQKN